MASVHRELGGPRPSKASGEEIFQALIFECVEGEIHHGLLPVDEAGDAAAP